MYLKQNENEGWKGIEARSFRRQHYIGRVPGRKNYLLRRKYHKTFHNSQYFVIPSSALALSILGFSIIPSHFITFLVSNRRGKFKYFPFIHIFIRSGKSIFLPVSLRQITPFFLFSPGRSLSRLTSKKEKKEGGGKIKKERKKNQQWRKYFTSGL